MYSLDSHYSYCIFVEQKSNICIFSRNEKGEVMPTNKEPEIRQIGDAAIPVFPVFSNITSIQGHEDFVFIDFGFFAPSYSSSELTDTQLARICLTWETARELLKDLQDAVRQNTTDQNRRQKKNLKEK
jgi:hypothetical protein